MIKRILVGLDGSPGSMRAFQEAVSIADRFGASLNALSVVEPAARYAGTVGEVDDASTEAEAYYQTVHDQAKTIAERHGVSFDASIVHGHPARTLIEQTRAGNLDLLVLGQSGHSNVWGTVLGTTTDKVSRHAASSVLIVR
jgi:nucleotide-binding universal stress UspA family protein